MWEAPADLSDHAPITAVGLISATDGTTSETSHKHFLADRLQALKLPADEDTWRQIDNDINEAPEMQQIMDSLHTHLANPEHSKEDNQKIVDDNLDMLTKLIYKVFHTYRLVKKRTFSKTSKTADADRAAAPPELRALRLEANTARKLFVKLMKTEADGEAVASAKKDWNRLSKCCRSVSTQARSSFHMSWRTTWLRLQRSSPRKLWCTFRSLTRQTTVEPTCSPDQQWEHWSTQGYISETV